MKDRNPGNHSDAAKSHTGGIHSPHTTTARPGLDSFGTVDLLLLGVVTVWGVNFSIIKFALAEMSPLTFVGLRFLLASITMLVLARAIEGNLHVQPGDWPRMVVIGLVGHATFQFLFVLGLDRTQAGHSSLMLGLTPVFVALIGFALGIERVGKEVWASIGLAFIGVVLITSGAGGGARPDGSTLPGDLLSLAATFFWASYTVLAQPLLRRYTPIELTAVTMLPGTIPLIAAAIPAWWAQDWSQVTVTGWLALLYSSDLAIVVAYIVWYASVQRVGSARTAIFSNLVPAIALAAAWLLRGETLLPLQWVGATVVLVGVSLARRR